MRQGPVNTPTGGVGAAIASGSMTFLLVLMAMLLASRLVNDLYYRWVGGRAIESH